MKDKFPEIFKNKIDNVKCRVQKEYYYHANKIPNEDKDERKIVDRTELLNKINGIFERPDFVYETDITIMYKNGESINQRIVGLKENYLINIAGEKIYINDILDIK